MKTVVIGDKPGGTIILTNDIANYPGFKQISGMELSEKLLAHAKDYNPDLVDEKVTKITTCPEGCFRVYAGGTHYHTKTMLFATGTEWKKLNVPGEKEFTGNGVHYCALCDGPFYRGKTVAVVGGSDSAAKEALLLTEYANKVFIIYRAEKIRPEPINYKRVVENKKIEIIYRTNVVEIKGETFMDKAILDRPYNGSSDIKLDAIFVEIGHDPISDLAKSIGVATNDKGEIIVDSESRTNLSGVYAAGDVTNTRFKQAITGVAQGVTAAYSSYHYTKENEKICLSCDEEHAT